jgi:hypothetical protein
MDWVQKVAEEKIKEAIAGGEFDHLPGHGKPLKLDDLSGVPEDLRMAYRVLKNTGYVPEEMQLRKEIVSLQDLLNLCKDESERDDLNRKLTEKQLRFNMLMEQRGMAGSSVMETYRDKIGKKGL